MILICILLLSGLGTAIIGSVAPTLLWSQITFYLIGLALFFLFSRLDYRIYPNLAKLSYLISLVLLAITLLVGFETRGSIRWIPIGSFRLQFSELLKPVLVGALSAFLLPAPKKVGSFLKILFLMALPILLVFKQPDLGSAVVYSVGFLAIILVSGVELSYLLFLFFSTIIALPLGWHFLADYQKNRILGFLNPGVDPLGASYNAIQSVIAVGSGMFLGRGLGRGTQSHLLFLPEHHTDFVFASVAEELGFVGAAFLLVVYFILIWRIFNVSLRCQNRFGQLLGVGLGTILLIQVFINVGMNLGLFPVTGITLPLISYGGSSVLATMISLGVVENIARLSKPDDSNIIGT